MLVDGRTLAPGGKYTSPMDGMGDMQPSIAEISFFWISWIGEDKIGLWFWARAPFGEGRPPLPNVGGSPPTKKIPWESSLQGFIPRNHARTSYDFPLKHLDGFQTGRSTWGSCSIHWFSDVKVLSSVSWENGGFNLGSFLEMPEMLRHKCLHPDGMPGFFGATCIPLPHKMKYHVL